ncbi:sarcosine oxidase subunit gamma [Shinella zoogloeoides]|jgi:heterotetrameric sarcosine oxidase gamma subunit|uniref:sarcosine oxidase subunit gamma n=1 Tax=Shinella zoogloeoides TaxID=352475 RepID=UPI00273D1620|nr:sarcosine oxidase subunit gamma family protein [Shinella zoogloeoides]WLR91608.1 sarcosine oxidase subunit gamma family protein [Shinella zoogloeoides]
MAYDYQAVHALDGTIGAISERRANHLAVHRATAIAMVLAAPGWAAEAAGILVSDGEFEARFSGPGEWLVLSEVHAPETLVAELAVRLGDFAHIVDQSHGRVMLTLCGPDAARILANGIALDLHADAFPVGRAANVLCNHLSVNLARTGETRFDLVVMRSFAEALVGDLKVMARSFDLSVDFATR